MVTALSEHQQSLRARSSFCPCPHTAEGLSYVTQQTLRARLKGQTWLHTEGFSQQQLWKRDSELGSEHELEEYSAQLAAFSGSLHFAGIAESYHSPRGSIFGGEVGLEQRK